MAILGFLLLVIVGLVLVAYAIAAASATASFAGKVEWPPVLVFGGVGALIDGGPDTWPVFVPWASLFHLRVEVL